MTKDIEILHPIKIEQKIYSIQEKRVMLDRDLAELYQVETRILNQAVRRNIDLFPADFMISLTREEIKNLSQIVISSKIKHAPSVFAFTEQGVAMLSCVLKSPRARMVNIQIMRTFVKLRELLLSHKDLREKINHLEKQYNQQFTVIFEAIRHIINPPEKPKKFGIIIPEENKKETKK